MYSIVGLPKASARTFTASDIAFALNDKEKHAKRQKLNRKKSHLCTHIILPSLVHGQPIILCINLGSKLYKGSATELGLPEHVHCIFD